MSRPILILASSSPRRVAYLRDLGFSFRRIAPEIDETRRRGESPVRYVSRLAATKANAVAERYPGHWVVGADTGVVVKGKLLGKPSDRRDAARMLKLLSGRSHRVFSGIALARARDGALHVATSSTRVVFRPLTADEIHWYVRTGEPMDKAGAYGIQGKGGLLVARIEGSFSNVAGFPIERFFELWKDAGLPLP